MGQNEEVSDNNNAYNCMLLYVNNIFVFILFKLVKKETVLRNYYIFFKPIDTGLYIRAKSKNTCIEVKKETDIIFLLSRKKTHSQWKLCCCYL